MRYDCYTIQFPTLEQNAMTKCYDKMMQEIKSYKVLEFKYNNGFLCPHKTQKEYNNS